MKKEKGTTGKKPASTSNEGGSAAAAASSMAITKKKPQKQRLYPSWAVPACPPTLATLPFNAQLAIRQWIAKTPQGDNLNPSLSLV